MRSRKALQYATSIDDYVRIMLDGNNGGYANDWLLGDNKNGEIAQFELGLKAHQVWRTTDGYFVGSNFARDPDVLAKDTTFDINNLETSPNARRIRWEQLMKEAKGKIDVKMAENFMADHYDSYQKKVDPDERTLCGHGDRFPARYTGLGMGPVLSWRRGTGRGHGCHDGESDELSRAYGPPLRNGFSRRALP